MPLDKPTLVSDIKTLLNDLKTRENNQQAAVDDYATSLADAIEKYVLSGDVNTVGSATAQTGKIS